MGIFNRNPNGSRIPVIVAIVIVGIIFIVVGAVVPAVVLGTFALSTGEQAGSTPSISFQFGVNGGTATITHADDDSSSAEEMFVITDNSERSWASLSGTDGTVAKGNPISFDVASGETIELICVGGDGHELVGRFSV